MNRALPGEHAYRELAARDTVMAGLIDLYGTPDPFRWSEAPAVAGGDPLAGLLLHICGQQISIRAALAVYGRLLGLLRGGPSPAALAALTMEQLREVGFSRAKAEGIRDLARRLTDASLSLAALATASDEQAVTALTAVRGIGPWTAQLYLLHQLHRPDVLPAGDVGLRHAAALACQLPRAPSASELTALAEPWRPHRSYATALLWTVLRAHRSERGARGPCLSACGERARGRQSRPAATERGVGCRRHPTPPGGQGLDCYGWRPLK
ncbi:DNA-3-methyladenine glycosylase family protein [Protofrankia symbiont of Coriaria ruscifolia]|uniref:DNA-3-methyladenine glycosylase family protein n=1 Tax=Protofrankia symbiont of Coriaria ruscifolia TaxID=1306542 RepID=UPI0010415AD3|nr:DNA-3-methyladenine glycosylase [Protofrankia symbiont of Coriaria ruscifolia]